MKLFTKLLLIVSLLNILFTTEKTFAKSNNCEQIRQVRRLAFQEGLDGQNLATLEARYCGATISSGLSLPSPNASEDCIDLTVMKRLARMTARNRHLVSMIEDQQQETCQLSLEHSSFDWSNGKKAKSLSTWYYPNREEAKSLSTWYYPNGAKAKSLSTWYYPNGAKAKSLSTWYDPNGNSTSSNSLLDWACEVVEKNECNDSIAKFNQTKEFWNELELVELSWKAYKIAQ